MIVYTAGIKLVLVLHVNQHHLSYPVASTIAALVCLFALVPSAEIFHRAVDHPSRMLAYWAFDWIRE